MRLLATKRRKESITGIYHVIVKGINKERIFNQQREKIYFKQIILKHLELFTVEIYSYCIMSNHAHFMIRAEIQQLSRFMAVILTEYALYYNFKHRRNGHVFQNRFTSECIENEKYFWTCLRYIHLNPVKAGMIKNIEKYKYSSWNEYKNEECQILHEKALLMYHKSFRDYKEFETFHKEREKQIYLDIEDDILSQKKCVAKIIAEDIFKEKQLSLISQVFEEKSIREEYISRLRDILKVSQKKAKELCNMIMNEIENE